MNLDVQFRINSNPNYVNYIRQNSHWYKLLNRSPELFPTFVDEMKEAYKMHAKDKISSFGDKLELVNMFMKVFK